MPKFNAHCRALDWLFRGFNLAEFDDFLLEEGWDTPQALANREILLDRRSRAVAAFRAGNEEATQAWLDFLRVAMQLVRQRGVLLPLARKGHDFTPKGRGIGKVRKAVRAHLSKWPTDGADAIWAAWKVKPPHGFILRETQRLGPYIEVPGQKDIGFPRLRNIVSEERQK